ncbi:hypothetical protein ACH35V_29745 [Actinomadura sp. 1N219]|uniref:hypothetical protein n=1 Tax=Actinomadura sp. 1N219 TaxID=3375152 RepID=UPI0037B89103
MFASLNGDPVSPGRLRHGFQGLLAEHRLPPVLLHDLRHGAATLAPAAGEVEGGARRARALQLVLTADTYTSVLPKLAHTAAEQAATYVLRAGWRVPAPDGADDRREGVFALGRGGVGRVGLKPTATD